MHQLLEPKGASRAFKQEEVWNAERTLAQRSREDRDLGSTQPRRVAERDRPSCRPQPGGRTASGQPDRRGSTAGAGPLASRVDGERARGDLTRSGGGQLQSGDGQTDRKDSLDG